MAIHQEPNALPGAVGGSFRSLPERRARRSRAREAFDVRIVATGVAAVGPRPSAAFRLADRLGHLDVASV